MSSIEPSKWWECSSLTQSTFFAIAGGTIAAGADRLYELFAGRVFKAESQNILNNFDKSLFKANKTRFCLNWGLYGFLVPTFESVIYNGVVRETQIDFQKQNGTDPTSPSAIVKRTLVNASLFTVFHLSPKQSLRTNLYITPPIFFSGVVYNLLTEATGDIFATSFAHIGNNNLVLLQKFKK